MATLRDILNRARWRDADLHALEVHILHRGAPGDRRVIAGTRIIAVRSSGFELAPEATEGDPIFVPYHRVLAVFGEGSEELWSKEGGERVVPPLVPSRAPEPIVSEGTEIESTISVVPRGAGGARPLTIDGSAGEGGGQILRSSLALSMVTGAPFILENIRAGRKKPGLMRQHLTCVKAAAMVSGANVEGAELGSSRIVFRPGVVRPGDHVVDIGSAGSAALVIQTLALPLALARGPSRVVVRGGTHVAWAPTHSFLELSWRPAMERAGVRFGLELVASGFYPAGGGEVVLAIEPGASLGPLHIGDPSGVLAPLSLHAIVSNLAEGIARRELSAAAELLKGTPATLTSATVRSPGPGNAMWLVARDEGTGVTNVFSGIGEVGVQAEEIGRKIAEEFLAWRASGASIEPHLADQVMLPIALAGGGSFTTNELTLHSRTNIEVIDAFTGRRLRAWELPDGRVRVALR